MLPMSSVPLIGENLFFMPCEHAKTIQRESFATGQRAHPTVC